MGKKKIEVFSNLIKTETVEVIKKKIIPGSLVFESKNPYPGYYHETPGYGQESYMYIALERHYSLEEILRATQKVESVFDGKFDAGKGILTLFNDVYYVLRLRHFGNYDMIVKIQDAYSKEGLKLLTSSRRLGIHEAKTEIVKFLLLEKVGKNSYFDAKEASHGYIIIPRFLDRDEFYDTTMKVRYNWTGSSFDAASGSFYYKGELHEMVRIYSQKLTPEYLCGIRGLYLKKIK